MFPDGAKADGEGWYLSCGCQDATVAPAAKDFTAAYQAMFNTPPSTYSPEAYDATNIVHPGDQDGQGRRRRSPVRRSNDAVNKTRLQGHHRARSSSPPTVTCPRVTGTVNLFQVKGGKIVSLGDITQAP